MLHAFDLDTPSLAQELFPEFMERKRPRDTRLAEDYKPRGHSASEIREWLIKTISQEKITATEWARMSGLAPSTLNRFINAVDSGANLTARTIESLAIGRRRISENRSEKRSEDYDVFQIARRLMTTVDVPVIGEVSAHNVRQRRNTNSFVGRNFLVPVMYEMSKRPIAAFATMDAFHNAYPSGSIILATPVRGIKHYPIKNARYIFHRKIGDDQIFATIFRLAQDPQASYWFLPVGEQKSSNPGIFIGNRLTRETSEISGKATFLVIGSVSPDPNLQTYYDLEEMEHYDRRQASMRDAEAESREEESGEGN